MPRLPRVLRLAALALPVLVLGCLPDVETDVEASAVPPAAPAAVADTVRPGYVPTDTPLAVDDSTRAVFRALLDRAAAEGWQALRMGDLVQTVGGALVGAPYVDGLLDADPAEALVINLRAFDCVLFVENTLALAEGIAAGDTTFAGFARRLEALRYRDGARDGYASRLHYFSDWLRDNDARGHVRLVTDALPGAAPYAKPIDFMTAHRASYPKLAARAPQGDSLLAAMARVEARLNAAPTLAYLPQDRIAGAYAALRPGDVVATTTDIDGLDVTHTGLVIRTEGGGTGFLHASSTGEVKVAPDLAAYVRGNAVQTGLLVARPVDPRAGS